MNNFFEIFINYATLISYIAFSIDLFIQIRRIFKRKSAKDISWKGTMFRVIGSLVILIKFIGINDIFLIVGQIVFSLAVGTYLFAVIKYRNTQN